MRRDGPRDVRMGSASATQEALRGITKVPFTLAGVAIGVGVMLLANLMEERAAAANCAQPAAT